MTTLLPAPWWPSKGLITALAVLLIGYPLLALPASAQPPERVDCEGTISGKVTTRDGAPVIGAQVASATVPKKNDGAGVDLPPEDSKSWVVHATATDNTGRYRFANVCFGVAIVSAKQPALKPGKAPTPPPLSPRTFYDADGDGRPDRIELTEDSPRADGIDIQLRTRSERGGRR